MAPQTKTEVVVIQAQTGNEDQPRLSASMASTCKGTGTHQAFLLGFQRSLLSCSVSQSPVLAEQHVLRALIWLKH